MLTEQEFYEYIKFLLVALKGEQSKKNLRTKCSHIYYARWIYRRCVREMNDKDRNLRRWLMEKPCVFKSPLTKRKIEINIGKDAEALYYFLEYCRKLHAREVISDNFTTYLAYIITRSMVWP